MRVDVTKVLRVFKDSPDDDGILKDPQGSEITLRKVCTAALTAAGPMCPRCGTVQFAADTQDGEVKFHRWMLAQRIEKAKKMVDLSNDEVKMLKDSVASNQATIVSGQVWELLDPAKAKQYEEKEARMRKTKPDPDPEEPNGK